MSYLQNMHAGLADIRGGIAGSWGQTYDVYRLGASTSGSVISGQPLYTNFHLKLEQKAQKVRLENATFDLIVFTGLCDNTKLQKGDVLVETGFESDSGIWIFAQERPTHDPIFVRAETPSFISRPYTEAGAVAQQPSVGVAAQTGYGGTRISIEKYLMLNNGLYTFAPDATVGASLPCGIQPLNRVRDGTIPQVPTKQYRTHHLIYVPMLPGEMLDVQDRINAANGDRYEAMEVHSTHPTGLDGYIVIAEKMAT